MELYKALKKLLASKFEISVSQLLVFIAVAAGLIFIPWRSFVQREQISKEKEGLGVYDLIRDVKNELAKADSVRVSRKEAPLFRLKDFEMEISFIVRKSESGSQKIVLDMVSVESLSEAERSSVQKLNLRWEALPDVIDTVIFEPDTAN